MTKGQGIFLIIIALIAGGSFASRTITEFRQNKKIEALALTSTERLAHAVITVPGTNELVGLIDGIGSTKDGTRIEIQSPTSTHFSPLIRDKFPPRTDVITALKTSKDGSATYYIVLFYDKGDAVVMRSYAELPGSAVVVKSLDTPPRGTVGDYDVTIRYITNGEQRTATLPVSDGHFIAPTQ